MKRKRNPVRRTGERNVLCPLYNQCLDYTAKRYWESWDCSKCRNRSAESSLLDSCSMIDQAVAYYEVSKDVDVPKNWMEY